jgi:mono/diheme cytochrome c family protein
MSSREMPLKKLRPPGARRSRPLLLTAAVGALLVAAGCRQDMHDQPKLKPYRSSQFFANGSGFQEFPAHTVARGTLQEDPLYSTGKLADGSPATELPMPMTRALMLRGQERYNIFCSPCHGRLGDGRGMVVQRGYKQPTSYHDERLRQAPVGYFFDVMTNGFGVMSSYAPQVPVADRWAIAAYIRALQLSQHADAATLTAEQRARLDGPAQAPATPAGTAHP